MTIESNKIIYMFFSKSLLSLLYVDLYTFSLIRNIIILIMFTMVTVTACV